MTGEITKRAETNSKTSETRQTFFVKLFLQAVAVPNRCEVAFASGLE